MKAWLSGKKTYLIAVSSLIGVAVAWSTGQIDTFSAIQSAIGCILAVTIRNGIN